MEPTTLLPTQTPSKNGHHPQTGPKSPGGKMQSRMNAISHGMEATDEIFATTLPPHQKNAFMKIRRALHRHYKPRTVYEKLIVDRMVIQHIRMLRLYQIETINMRFFPIVKASNLTILPHLDRLSRYDVRIEKQLRILHNRLVLMIENRGQNSPKSIPTTE
jgi:hypothetical protein